MAPYIFLKQNDYTQLRFRIDIYRIGTLMCLVSQRRGTGELDSTVGGERGGGTCPCTQCWLQEDDSGLPDTSVFK